MLKRVAIVLGLALGILVVAGAALYLLGGRIQLDGGGGFHLVFPKSEDEQARDVARHREAQRAASGSPPSSASPAASPESSAASAPSAPLPAPGAQPAPATPSALSPGDWTDFRGPERNGAYESTAIRLDWPSSGLKPVWKQPIGGGYASLVAAKGRAFTIEQRGANEVAAGYDVATGRELWTSEWSAVFREAMGGPGPRATPTWHDGKLYVLGATGELRALDAADGRTIWRTNILEDAGASNIQWGMSAAPLIVDDTVVVLPGGRAGQSIVAYDRGTGRRAWASLNDQASYSSPMLATIGGVRQILVFTASRLAGITPDRGELLWEFPWTTPYDVNASQPLLVGPNRVFISTGYGSGAVLVEPQRGADGRWQVREVWRTNRMKNQFTSSLLHDGHIYGLDESILACIDAATGALKWKGGRYGYGQVMLAGGHLIVVTEGGELALVRATPDGHNELARFPALDGRTWNHPAISGGYLLVRNASEMAAFDLRK
jgi:outer membrane protein assembly factor BamB